jgi:hypothetical protein
LQSAVDGPSRWRHRPVVLQPVEGLVDERGRTSLARVRSHDYDRYIVEECPDGTLTLTPTVTISPVELAALRDPDVMAAVTEAKTGDRSALQRRPGTGSREGQGSAG